MQLPVLECPCNLVAALLQQCVKQEDARDSRGHCVVTKERNKCLAKHAAPPHVCQGGLKRSHETDDHGTRARDGAQFFIRDVTFCKKQENYAIQCIVVSHCGCCACSPAWGATHRPAQTAARAPMPTDCGAG